MHTTMKELMNCYLNWRVDFLLLAAVFSLLLLSATDGGGVLTRVAGIIIAASTYKLGRQWKDQGKLPELDKLSE